MATDKIDLAPMFASPAHGPTHSKFTVLGGFAPSKVLTNTQIKNDAVYTHDAVSVAGLDIQLNRADSTEKYMYVFIPDSLGAIQGFMFSGFLDVWQSTTVTVDGNAGKVYISDNPTHSTNVDFEVRA